MKKSDVILDRSRQSRSAGWLRTVRQDGNWAIPLALVALWPMQWVLQNTDVVDRYTQRILILVGINITATVGLQLINGISGQFSLGHAGFMAVGAYSAAAAARLLPAGLPAPVALPASLLIAGLFAGAAGLVIGIPTLRLRGDYLAIATLGFAEIITILITNSRFLGGALGLEGIPQYSSFAWVYGVATVMVIAIWRLVRSARGRALLAVREDEVAAASVGIDPTRQKVLAFVVGAFAAGAAGALFAHYEGYITPQHFSFMHSIELVVMVTLAGSGSISGTILAAVVLTYLPEGLRDPPWPISLLRVYQGFETFLGVLRELRMVLYSLILILLMLLRPAGLLGGRELWCTRRRQRHSSANDAAVARS